MNTNLLVWLVLPYLSIILLIGGMIWRYRTDQFGWTSRSSQWNEPSILRWSSPLFHFGILFVFLGHVLGLVIPQSWTSTIGITEDTYHVMATVLGSAAGLAARRTPRAVVPQVHDKVGAPHDNHHGHRHLCAAHSDSHAGVLGHRTPADDCRRLQLPRYYRSMVPLHRAVSASTRTNGHGTIRL
ncbi:respiratory nitrate reductase gamma chain [Cutibacterium acnes JCM 18916]|nr:respiratory nitrate reductase gamma chain [Cutibacterium acnes JCM 18916]